MSLYLCNRPQCVKIGESLSDFLHVLCGVPQGSVLGPILFLISINDLQFCSNIYLPDDTSLYFSHRDAAFLEDTVNSELNNVLTWLQANKLTLNVSKSSFIIFKHMQRKITKNISIKINDSEIEGKLHTKYLGVILDEKLSWKQHIDQIIPKLQRGIGILAKLSKTLS